MQVESSNPQLVDTGPTHLLVVKLMNYLTSWCNYLLTIKKSLFKQAQITGLKHQIVVKLNNQLISQGNPY